MKNERMTWGDFKKAVEAEGVTDDTVILYIDISGYEAEMRVTIRDDGWVEIW